MHKNFSGLKVLGWVVAGVLGAGCTGGSDARVDESTRSARSAIEPTDGVLPIDDFQTGADTMALTAEGSVQKVQSGTSILGGTRCVGLDVTWNPLDRPATTEISGQSNGFLALETGVGVSQALSLRYGFDAQCNALGLDQDLTGLTGFHIDFATYEFGGETHGALDLGTAGAIAVFSEGGASSYQLSIDADTPSRYVPFSEFEGDVDWQHVQEIVFEIQSGYGVPGHDYVIRSISAVTK